MQASITDCRPHHLGDIVIGSGKRGFSDGPIHCLDFLITASDEKLTPVVPDASDSLALVGELHVNSSSLHSIYDFVNSLTFSRELFSSNLLVIGNLHVILNGSFSAVSKQMFASKY